MKRRQLHFRIFVGLAALWATAALPNLARAQTIQWIRQFGSPTDDTSYRVAVDATGIYVSGVVTGTLPGQTSAGGVDAFVRKYDPNGNELWTRQFGSAPLTAMRAGKGTCKIPGWLSERFKWKVLTEVRNASTIIGFVAGS